MKPWPSVERTQLARGLRSELDVEHVRAKVAGLAVPHFHEHVLVRHVDSLPDQPWSQQWENGPQGDLHALAARLSTYVVGRRQSSCELGAPFATHAASPLPLLGLVNPAEGSRRLAHRWVLGHLAEPQLGGDEHKPEEVFR